jgi:AcrR family transcriptional regulator
MQKAAEQTAGRMEARIMAHAGRVFHAQGFRKVTVEELCAGLGISKRTFYRYFRDKEALVERVVRERFERVGAAIHANLTSDRPVRERLLAHFDLLVAEFAPAFSVSLMMDLQTQLPEVMAVIADFRARELKLVAALFKQGQREGTIRREIDAEVLGRLLQGLVVRIASPEFLIAQGLTLDQLVATMRTLVLHGLLTDKKHKGS